MNAADPPAEGAAPDLPAARHAKEALLASLGDHPLVTGCGVARTSRGYAVTISLVAAWEGEALPTQVEGVPLQVRVIGPVHRQGLRDEADAPKNEG